MRVVGRNRRVVFAVVSVNEMLDRPSPLQAEAAMFLHRWSVAEG